MPLSGAPGVQAAFLVSATFSGRTLLGRHSRPSRTRVIARRIPVAAAPAIVGAALATGCASTGQVAAQAPVHQTAAQPVHQTPAEAAAAPSGPAAAELMSLSRPAIVTSSGARAAATKAVAARGAAPARYKVQAGDTLSSIAKRVYHDPRYWPVLYRANHKALRYANEITAGQVLTVPAKPAKIPATPAAPDPAPVQQSSSSATTVSATTAPAQVASTTVSTTGDSSFQACVIARESGGNSQVMNASGHYGLYQFSASTWAAYGGNPADFGHASVAEQNQVFENAIAAGGQSNWSLYDGC